MSRRLSSRRRFLATGILLGTAGVAGCIDSGSDDTDEPTDDDTTDDPDGAENETDDSDEEDDETNDPTEEDDETNDSDDGEESTEPIHAEYETTEVRVESNGEILGSVTAAIADTPQLRYTGLSDTASLPEDRGMLFIFEEAQNLTFVMREMDFAIDIIFVDSDGTITEIHHAPAPGPDEDGESQQYGGYGQYVLEVNYEWTTDHGVETGDRLVFEQR